MPTSNDTDAPVSVMPVPPALSAVTALPASSSEPAAGVDSAALAPLDDIPPLDPTIEPVEHRSAELSSRIQAATYDLLVLIREFDARSGWSGWTSCARWLSWRTGLGPGPAREHVRVARALKDLPKSSDAMRRGTVSYSKARPVTRVATPETWQALLDAALCGTAAHVEQVVRGWRQVDRTAEKTKDRRRLDGRSLRTWVDDDGMMVVQGRLTPEVGAVLRRALEAACDRAQARRAAADDGAYSEASDVAAVEEELAPAFAHRQADAIGVIAECALAGGLDRGTAGDRYQVVLHVDAGALAEGPDVPAVTSECAEPETERGTGGRYVPAGTPTGGGMLRRSSQPCPGPNGAATPKLAACSQTVLEEAGGIHVSAETARRLVCEAAIVEMQHGAGGEILDVGRRTRTISPALRRALAARDGQCRFPGCQNRRCDSHHIVHWADGGETALDNLVLLCRRHHRAVHEEGFRITLDAAGEVEFMPPNGRPFPVAPPPLLWTGAPLAPVTERLGQDGIEIGAQTATPAWRGERLDIEWVVGLLWRPRPDGSADCE